MIRGGDTPKQETLWAIEFESGKFAFGHANENEIVVATIPLGRKIWYADDSGVIIGTTESIDEVTGTIIDTYNEYFGTDISHLTTEAVLFKVGDKVYNWNAYEKIEIPSRKIAFDINTSSPVYIFGAIENDVLHLNVDENEGSWLATSEGEIRSGGGPGMSSKTWIIQQFNEQGISLTDIVANLVQYEVGQIVPNWSQYEKIG